MPFVLSYQDAPSKPEVGGVTIVTLLVRWGPPEQAGSPTDWSPKVARKRKGGGPPGATRRRVLQTVGEPNPKTRREHASRGEPISTQRPGSHFL